MNKKGMAVLTAAAVVMLAAIIIFFIFSDDENGGSASVNGSTQNAQNQTGEGESGTGEGGLGADKEENTEAGSNNESTIVEPLSEVVKISEYEWDDGANTTVISLGNAKTASEASVDGDGVRISGSDILIENGGQYEVTGSLEDGRIVVNVKNEQVIIRLNNADISCSYSSAVYGYEADKLVLLMADGSVNNLSDASSYNYSDDYSIEAEAEPNACVYAKMDLLICGSGALNINGNFEQGVTGKDNLDIAGASLNVVSVGKAVLGKDRLAVSDALIEADAEDDALHSNGNILLDGGKYLLTSKNDGIHADSGVVADGADITVYESEEGIEGWQIYLLNSKADVTADDDGLNATNKESDGMDFGGFGGNKGGFGGRGEMPDGNLDGGAGEMPDDFKGGQGEMPDRGFGGGRVEMPQEQQSASSGAEIKLVLNNSNVFINSGGDGIDSNGSVYMDGGTVIVYGPSDSGNGGLDFASTFELVSGTLLVTDVTGMNMLPTSSEVLGIDVTLTQNLSAGDVVNVSSENCSFCFDIIKKCSHFTLISPDMKSGDNVKVLTGGSTAANVSEEHLVSGADYSGGTEAADLTLDNGIASYGSRGMGGRF